MGRRNRRPIKYEGRPSRGGQLTQRIWEDTCHRISHSQYDVNRIDLHLLCSQFGKPNNAPG